MQPTDTPQALADELEGLFGDRAVDGLWCHVSGKTMMRILTALRTDRQAGEVGVTGEGLEQAGWDWLDGMVSSLCDEHPSDIAYSADQMVDAFAAGVRLAHRTTSTSALAEENARLRAGIEEIANPLAAIQRRAEAEGLQIHGPMALALSNDPAHLKSLARALLHREGTAQ